MLSNGFRACFIDFFPRSLQQKYARLKILYLTDFGTRIKRIEWFDPVGKSVAQLVPKPALEALDSLVRCPIVKLTGIAAKNRCKIKQIDFRLGLRKSSLSGPERYLRAVIVPAKARVGIGEGILEF